MRPALQQRAVAGIIAARRNCMLGRGRLHARCRSHHCSGCIRTRRTAPAAPDTTASPGTGGNATAASADPAAVAAAVDAATAFLATLSEDQRDAVMFDFTDLGAKESSWSNFPVGIFDGRRGARMGDLDDAQRAAALAVVETMMSAAGYDYIEGVYVEGVMAGVELLAGGGSGRSAKTSTSWPCMVSRQPRRRGRCSSVATIWRSTSVSAARR